VSSVERVKPGLALWNNIHATPFAIKHDHALDQGKKGIVLALSHALAWMEAVADLPDENMASLNLLAAEFLYTASLSVRVSTVPTATLSLLMSHWLASLGKDFDFEQTTTFSDKPKDVQPVPETRPALGTHPSIAVHTGYGKRVCDHR